VKLKPREIDAFIRKPDPAVQAILVFGPDQGLVQERCRHLAKTVLEDLTDPFRLTDMSDADLRQDPARLADEAAAISMMVFWALACRIRRVESAFGSQPTIITFLPSSARAATRFWVVVDLPIPPLP